MPATEAILMLEQVMKKDEIEAYRNQMLNYSSSLPLWVNSNELPEPPEPPNWLSDEIND